MKSTETKTLLFVISFVVLVPSFLLVVLVPAISRAAFWTVFIAVSYVALIAGLWLVSKNWSKVSGFLRHGLFLVWKSWAGINGFVRRVWQRAKDRRRRAKLAKEKARFIASEPAKMLAEPWRDYRADNFEHFVARAFRVNGIKAVVTKSSSDQGIDVIAGVEMEQ